MPDELIIALAQIVLMLSQKVVEANEGWSYTVVLRAKGSSAPSRSAHERSPGHRECHDLENVPIVSYHRVSLHMVRFMGNQRFTRRRRAESLGCEKRYHKLK